MNERIKQLALQAKQYSIDKLDETGELHKYYDVYFEKFAELLIEDNIQTLINNGYTDAAQCLQDVHFGLKEAP